MENVNVTINGANLVSVTADPNALVVIPDGGQLQQPTTNPNALVSIADGGAPPGFGPMHTCYGSAGQNMAFGQFNVPLGQNMGYSHALIQGQIPMVQHVVPNPIMHTTHVRHVPPVTPVVSHVSTAHAERPEMFNGSKFKFWEEKMLFYLTTINLYHFLKEETPVVTPESDMQTVYAADAWKHANYICQNYVLSRMIDSLYNVYSSKTTTKDLWESLEHKYKTEDVGAKKWIVGHFFDHKMVDSKTVVSQVQELQMIIHDSHSEGMVINECFQVATMIEKLPPAWKEFKNYLKHKRKEMTMEDLIIRLRIEEDNRGFEREHVALHHRMPTATHKKSFSRPILCCNSQKNC